VAGMMCEKEELEQRCSMARSVEIRDRLSQQKRGLIQRLWAAIGIGKVSAAIEVYY
jgi:hypothetical protein